jgi:hypothetical protein
MDCSKFRTAKAVQKFGRFKVYLMFHNRNITVVYNNLFFVGMGHGDGLPVTTNS